MHLHEPVHESIEHVAPSGQDGISLRAYDAAHPDAVHIHAVHAGPIEHDTHLERSLFMFGGHGQITVGETVFTLREGDRIRIPRGYIPICTPDHGHQMRLLLIVVPEHPAR